VTALVLTVGANRLAGAPDGATGHALRGNFGTTRYGASSVTLFAGAAFQLHEGGFEKGSDGNLDCSMWRRAENVALACRLIPTFKTRRTPDEGQLSLNPYL
jgi:hypothetical protein